MTVPAEMPPDLVHFLLGGQTCVIATVDDRGGPQTTLMTWVVARNQQTVTIAMDVRGAAFRNVRQNGRIAVEVLGDDLCYGLRGAALVEKDAMDSTPFPCALVAVKIEDVRDHGAGGVRFVGPRYNFHPGKEHRKGVEEAIFAELKGPAPTV